MHVERPGLEHRGQRAAGIIDLHRDLLRVEPVELEVAANHAVEIRPGAGLRVRTLRHRRRARRGRVRNHEREEGEVRLRQPSPLRGVQRLEPGVGEAVDLGTIELLIAVAVALFHHHRRERRAGRERRQHARWTAARRGRRGVLVIRIRRGMNAGQPFAPADEVEQGLPPRGGQRRVGRVVQERPRGAGQEHRVVLLEVLGRNVCRVVGDRRRPCTGLRPHRLDRLCGERNRRVHEAGGVRLDQDFARMQRARGRTAGERRHHRVDRCRLRRLRLPAAPTHVECRGQPRRGHCRVERRYQLVARHGARLVNIRSREPPAAGGFQFLARDHPVLVAIGGEEYEGRRQEPLEAGARAERHGAPLPCWPRRRFRRPRAAPLRMPRRNRVDQSFGSHVPSPEFPTRNLAACAVSSPRQIDEPENIRAGISFAPVSLRKDNRPHAGARVNSRQT